MQLLPKAKMSALIALVAIASAACVKQDDPGVGLVKFDSSAVFGITPDEKPVVPSFEVPEEAFALPDITPPKRFIPTVEDGPCPAAKLTAFPKKPAGVRVSDLPPEGVYKWKRAALTIKNANVEPPIKDFPFALEGRAIRRVTQDSDHQFSFDMLAPDPFVAGNTIITTFRVNNNDELIADRTVAARTIGVVNIPGTDVRVANPADAPGIFILRIEVQDSDGSRVSSFSPVQPMLIAPLEGGILRSGQQFRSVGIDATTGTAISNNGVTGRTSRVDACGEIVEGYAITLHQTLTSDVQQADDPVLGVGNAALAQETREVTYTFATQYGALPIAETLALGDLQVDAIAAAGKWELGGLTPTPLPDSLK